MVTVFIFVGLASVNATLSELAVGVEVVLCDVLVVFITTFIEEDPE